jgi:glycosyltransferase involved in cell wall biosynthesis
MVSPERLTYWLKGEKTQNFGDYLGEFILKTLFVAFDEGPKLHLAGSVIDDGMIPLLDDPIDPSQPRASFWGCGIRTRGGLLLANKAHIDLFAVRGPVSASELRLGSSVPTGDPGLLLPALYKARHAGQFQGKAVCIPHFNDQRSDEDLLSLAGGDIVLRSSIPNNQDAFLCFIDSVASADFVLSASLHGAVVAAAYGRPFAFWDSGHVDLPTKWEDFAGYANFEMHGAKTIREATIYYEKKIAPKLRIGSLLPLLANAPCQIKPVALLKVLQYELMREGADDVSRALDSKVEIFQGNSDHFDRLAERTRRYSQKRIEAASELNVRSTELSRLVENLSAQALDAGKNLQESQSRLDEINSRLNEERINFARKEADYGASLARLSSELALSKESQALANSELQNHLVESRSQIDVLRATLSRNETDLLLERNAKMSLDSRISRLEQEMVTRALRLNGRQNLLGRLLGRGAAERRELTEQARRIADYVATFEASRLMAPGESERRVRIVQFLLSASDNLPDLPFFDVPTYVQMYKESIPAGVNPLIHYLSCAPDNKQRPHVLFDTEYYQAKYPDSATMGLDAFAHYVKWGADKGYNPHPLFDTRYYLAQYPDVAVSRVNPLIHYLKHPECRPHPLFDTEFYLKQSPKVVCSGKNPLAHYLTEGAVAGLDPSPWFSSRFYLEGYQDVAAARINPLVHYLTFGARESRNPHPTFSTNSYLDLHPQLRQSGENPLVHFVGEGSKSIPGSKHRPNIPESGQIKLPAVVEPVLIPKRRRVLMVDACYPCPDKDSGSMDQVAFIQIFQSLGYDVTFAADLELGIETPYREKLESMQVKCVTYPEYQSIEEFLKRHANEVAICFLSRVHFGTRHIRAIRELCPEASVIYYTVDLHHVREQRQAALNGDSAGLVRAKETYSAEAGATRDSDATIVVSNREASYWRAEVPEAQIFMVPLIRDYKVGRKGGFGDRSAIAFVGGFKHVPNIDAVTHFLDDVWPLVRAEIPDVEFRVIGPDLPESLSTRSDPGVKFVGYVEDLEKYLAGIRLTVAPVRYGAGAKGKIVSSLASGVPCVASSIASEGMGLTDGVDVMVGDTPRAFAEKTASLYRDRDVWTTLSDNGMKLVSKQHSVQHGVDLMRNIIQSIASLKRTESPAHTKSSAVG